MLRPVAIVALCVFFLACTNIRVKPIDDNLSIDLVCIENNDRVIREDFLPAVRKGFHNHGISTEVYKNAPPDHCVYTARYTATQTWDMAMVLADAEIWVYKDKEEIGYGNFHLNAGGGLSLMKWQGAEKKILPLMDQMLEEYPAIGEL